jgi:hypothetical protein
MIVPNNGTLALAGPVTDELGLAEVLEQARQIAKTTVPPATVPPATVPAEGDGHPPRPGAGEGRSRPTVEFGLD